MIVRASFTCLCRTSRVFYKFNSTLSSPQVTEEVPKHSKVKTRQVDNGDCSHKPILANPAGTKDYGPKEMAIRKSVLEKIVSVFEKHGAETIETPTFELKEILTEKLQEDPMFIFNIKDEEGEKLALRYDLTVPFARYLAMHKVKNIKRYQIAKVFRRDTPSFQRGRYREFYQCDFDISGSYDPMLPDAECVQIIAEALEAVNVGDFIIKINHRQLLNGLFESVGVPEDKFKTICTTLDKLGKESWANVHKEMVETKNLDEKTADAIGTYVQLSGGPDLIETLKNDQKLCSSKNAATGLDDLKLLLQICDIMGLKDKIVVDLSLARGLDYYTGLIYEAVLLGKLKNPVGSVAGGGRYDNLVGMFDRKNHSVPCVGLSLGVDRIFCALEAKIASSKEKIRTTKTEIFVVSAHDGLWEERVKLCKFLYDQDVKTEHSYKYNPGILNQLQYCEKAGIPFAGIIGESELSKGIVMLRNVATREETPVPREKLVEELRARLDGL